jgi:hypothetical protein
MSKVVQLYLDFLKLITIVFNLEQIYNKNQKENKVQEKNLTPYNKVK